MNPSGDLGNDLYRAAEVYQPGSPESDTPRNLSIGFAVSVFVHSLPVLVWIFTSGREPSPPPQPQRLVVDLFGMISDRQVERRVRAEADIAPGGPSDPTPQRPRRAAQVARPRTPPTPQRPAQAPSPVALPNQAPSPPSDRQQTPSNSPTPSNASAGGGTPAPTGGNDDSDQTASTLQASASEAAILGKYSAAVIKRIKGHMVYPPDARLAGQAGNPTIRFSVSASGGIVPGSLVIARSSGHPSIDRAALRAAMESAPFPSPPRAPMDLKLTLGFERSEP